MFLNLLWLVSGSGLALLGSLILSGQLSVEEFGVVTGLFSFTTLLSAICSRGQQGVILSLSPGVSKATIKKALIKTAFLLILCSAALLINYAIYTDNNASLLLILIPFIILGVLTQILIGINQANSKLTYLGLYQSLPSLGRSLPAIFLLLAFFLSGYQLTIDNYFLLTLVVTSLVLAAIFIILRKEYSKANQGETSVHNNAVKRESYFWATSVLSSSYVSLIAPIILFMWGEFSAGIFGIYILFWNVTNIAISAIYNNHLLPNFANIRHDPDKTSNYIKSCLKITIATSFAIAITCITLFYICIQYIWPAEYKEHQLFFLLALTSLVIRPFSARLGLPFNFSNLIHTKTKIQIASLSVLIVGSTLLSLTKNHNLLALTIVLSELVVLFLYAHNKKRT